jgi:hypothetical protein
MDKLRTLIILVCLAVVSVAYVAHAQTQRTNPMNQKWEYMTLKVNQLELTSPEVKKALNDAGDSGWELVAVTSESTVSVSLNFLTFKRAR